MRLIPFALLLGALAGAPATAQSHRDGEADLAKEIAGRVEGKPVDCITLRNIQDSRIIDHTAIVYRDGRTLYVNRPRAGLSLLDSDDVLVTKTFSGELCSIDTVQLLDRSSRMYSGSVFLGKFVPYKLPPKN